MAVRNLPNIGAAGLPEQADRLTCQSLSDRPRVAENIDYFEVDANRHRHPMNSVFSGVHTISALLSPSKRRSERLQTAIRLIGQPPLTASNLQKAEQKLRTLQSDPRVKDEANTWIAICGRLKGKNTVSTFRSILDKQPENRLAFVNWAASFLSRDYYRRPGCPDALNALYHLSAYTKKSPDDLFARLVEALLVNWYHLGPQAEKAVSLLEHLYLDASDYTPGISAMASILANTGRVDAAMDYAQEAVSQQQFNFQAKALLSRLDNSYSPCRNSNKNQSLHRPLPCPPQVYEAMLYSPYFLQDPMAKFS